MRSSFTTPLFALALTLGAATAAAQTPEPVAPPPTPAAPADAAEPSPDWQPKAASNRAGLDFDMFLAENLTALTFTPYAQIGVTDHLFVDAAVPFGYGSFSISFFGNSISAGTFTIGNPVLGAHYADRVNDDVSFHVGGSIAVPTHPSVGSTSGSSSLSDSGIAVAVASEARAAYDFDRFAPNVFPVRLRGGVEVRILPFLYYRGDLSPIFMIPTNGNDFLVWIEQGNEIEARAPSGIGGGLRLQEVFALGGSGFSSPTSPGGSDRFQSAFEPFVGYEPKAPNLFARLGLLMALDTPLGFAWDTNKVATLRVTGGYKW